MRERLKTHHLELPSLKEAANEKHMGDHNPAINAVTSIFAGMY